MTVELSTASTRAVDGPDVLTMLQTQYACEQFVFGEAAALDDWRLQDWLGMLSPDIVYRIPIRTTVMHDQPGMEPYSATGFHMTDDFSSLRVRLNRLEGRAAWSERPHSRMRRHVSGVRITGASEAGLTVVSELLLFWARDVEEYLVSCRREDLLVEENGLKLARRTVYLDHDRLPVPNLSLPL